MLIFHFSKNARVFCLVEKITPQVTEWKYKQFVVSLGIEPRSLSMQNRCDDYYTMEP